MVVFTGPSCIRGSFLVGCLLFSVDGVLYLTECREEDATVRCYGHAILYTTGSLLFTFGSMLWVMIG